MVSHAGFVVSHADFRGFTRARFVVSHAPLIKGLTWYLTFLTRLLRFAVGITTAPQRGVEEPPACASRHACLRQGTAANTDSATSNAKTAVGQEENRIPNSRTASLHASGINIQGQECAKNTRKRPAKAWLEVS